MNDAQCPACGSKDIGQTCDGTRRAVCLICNNKFTSQENLGDRDAISLWSRVSQLKADQFSANFPSAQFSPIPWEGATKTEKELIRRCASVVRAESKSFVRIDLPSGLGSATVHPAIAPQTIKALDELSKWVKENSHKIKV